MVVGGAAAGHPGYGIARLALSDVHLDARRLAKTGQPGTSLLISLGEHRLTIGIVIEQQPIPGVGFPADKQFPDHLRANSALRIK